MTTHTFKTREELDSSIEHVRASPGDTGSVELIVCRPLEGQRAVLPKAEVNTEDGLVGDSWKARGYKNGPANLEMQINIMNSRATAALEDDRKRWPLAGDQFYVDFDLSKKNLPAGSRIQVGTAILEVTPEPHLGCKKFAEHFGKDAVMWVNSDEGKALNLRGINAKVIKAGEVNTGDSIRKLEEAAA